MKTRIRSGFSLPEILVAVTVLAVLAAVVVPAVTQYINRGDAPASASDIENIRNAVTGYVADTRHYPVNLQNLVTNSGAEGWKGPYFAGHLSSTAATATFTTNGSNVTLGPALTTSPAGHVGYLTTSVTLGASVTCQDLWNLEKMIDGSLPDSTHASTNASTGNLQWTSACNANSSAGKTQATSVKNVVLRVTATGT